MPPFPTRSTIGRVSLCLVATLVLVACAQNPGASGPTGSSSAACASAPSVPDDLAGWGQPATTPSVVPLIINSPEKLVCGENRVLYALLDSTSGAPVGAPDRKASIAFYDLGRDPSKPIATTDGTFVWAIKDQRGVYVANATFTEAGRYGAEVTTSAAGGPSETVRITFDVLPSSSVVKVGDPAPDTKTPTLADVGGDVTHVSTDTNPDPAFYKTSVDEALAKHQPFLLVFATPKFCTSAQCGPTLDSIKPYVTRYPSVTFINVEPYKLKLEAGSLQADTDESGQLQPTDVTDQWHLVNEPTVYVVNREGVVTANFDLIFSDAELTAALDAVK